MNKYIKPNLNLPISLHDCNITNINITNEDNMYCNICFEFEDGFFLTNTQEPPILNDTKVIFSKVDIDFCSASIYKDDTLKSISFNELSKLAQEETLEIIDETYGYNKSKFTCNLITANDFKVVEIEIYHFNETIYEY